jgi:assimilatory nitrate reductase catalytic subunit
LPHGTARLFAEGEFPTPDARARFVMVEAAGPATSASAEYPFVLNTGRIRDQWHTMTRTGLVPRLSSHIAEPFVALNPADAATLALSDDDLAVLRSRQGDATLRVRVTPDQPQGQLFAPMHWNRRFSGNGGINALTAPVTDAVSGQPELKHTPASLTPFKPAWTAFLITRGEAAPPPSAEYWTRSAAAGCTVLILAGTVLPADDLTAWAETLLPPLSGIDYHDKRRGIHRWARLDGDRLEACLFLSTGQPLPSRTWLVSLFTATGMDGPSRTGLLSGRPPADTPDEGRTVCSCFNVGLNRIAAAIRDGGLTSAEQIGAVLKAGTNCGSCIPELKELIGHVRCGQAA